MQNHICGVGLSARPGKPCPRCGTTGLPVSVITVSSLVADEKLSRITGDSYHLCTSPECPVAYFDGSGAIGDCTGSGFLPVFAQDVFLKHRFNKSI
ncbi:hypothetical protein SAMN02745218_00193 [Desulfofundulus australicus DSM 11792]|uniref:CopZ zinc binding domain-containing protein n=1 Tax=Desulfofundulus australicus DSM 11792 TaxID=1121425 RepID=A0A1M4T0X9_9FIRM|nr:hypothetical protein SAMN02745218_00193 [Desulfofundulus australicus DSM 11792]